MTKQIALAPIAAAAALLATAASLPAKAQQVGGEAGQYRLAQACGWYAITACTRSYRDAQRFARRFGSGRVVDTSSGQFPNFTPGYFCVAEGPVSRERAIGIAREWRLEGVAPGAYAKSAC